MTAHLGSHLRFEYTGDLLAAVPHLLGFHPIESLVVVSMRDTADHTLGLALRADLPPPERRHELAAQLLMPLAEHPMSAVVLVVVGGAADDPDPGGSGDVAPPELAQRGLMDVCTAAFLDAGVTVAHRLWMADTRASARWRCYDRGDCHGRLPDPSHSPMAAATAAAGVITYESREHIVATLSPADEETLSRRAVLLDRASRATEPGARPISGRRALALVRRAVTEGVGATPTLPVLSDDQVVRLALALCDDRVRDACLVFDDPDQAAAAERLWTALVRATPVPERAEPACLLAFAAHLRGDGALAGIAVQQAQAADPGHRLAGLLRQALAVGISPARLRRLGVRAAAAARHRLVEEER